MKTYCLACKKLTGNTNLKTSKYKGRLIMKSICPVCGSKTSRVISQGSGLFNSLELNALWNAFR